MPFKTLPLDGCEIISIQAMPNAFRKAADLIPSADSGALEKLKHTMSDFFGETADEIHMTLNAFIIRDSSGLTLIDAGLPVDNERSTLLSGMKEAGIEPDQITRVILTHGDMDHIGGTTQNDEPLYKNARYFVNKAQYDQIKGAGNDNFANFIAPLEKAGVLEITGEEGEIAPGFRIFPTPGHRTGAVSVVAHEQAVVVGDAWHTPVQVVHPHWSASFDEDGGLAATTRADIMEKAREMNWVAAVPHIPFGGLGRIGASSWIPL